MPPRASSRLDLLVLPAGEWGDIRASALVSLLDRDWLAHDEQAVRFLCNERGGFRVTCPDTGDAAARAFSAGLQRWREGGLAQTECTCGQVHPLAAFQVAPEAGFAASWIQRPNAPTATLDPVAAAVIGKAWPGFRVVLVRP